MTKILLIDDEPDILRVLSRSLRADGYGVSTAANGAEGLSDFERTPAEIVITDIKMPGMDIVSTSAHEFSCSFTPDGKEFYFTRRNPARGQNLIMVTISIDGIWTDPEIVPFIQNRTSLTSPGWRPTAAGSTSPGKNLSPDRKAPR